MIITPLNTIWHCWPIFPEAWPDHGSTFTLGTVSWMGYSIIGRRDTTWPIYYQQHHRNTSFVLLFKLTFEKLFDKVKWAFLLKIIEMWRFLVMTRSWKFWKGEVLLVLTFVQIMGFYMVPHFLPLFFEINADTLAILVYRVVLHMLIADLTSSITFKLVSILQYANSNIFC
jgi:hypothetical protein